MCRIFLGECGNSRRNWGRRVGEDCARYSNGRAGLHRGEGKGPEESDRELSHTPAHHRDRQVPAFFFPLSFPFLHHHHRSIVVVQSRILSQWQAGRLQRSGSPWETIAFHPITFTPQRCGNHFIHWWSHRGSEGCCFDPCESCFEPDSYPVILANPDCFEKEWCLPLLPVAGPPIWADPGLCCLFCRRVGCILDWCDQGLPWSQFVFFIHFSRIDLLLTCDFLLSEIVKPTYFTSSPQMFDAIVQKLKTTICDSGFFQKVLFSFLFFSCENLQQFFFFFFSLRASLTLWWKARKSHWELGSLKRVRFGTSSSLSTYAKYLEAGWSVFFFVFFLFPSMTIFPFSLVIVLAALTTVSQLVHRETADFLRISLGCNIFEAYHLTEVIFLWFFLIPLQLQLSDFFKK